MSDEPRPGGGSGTGCLIGAIAGAILLFVLLAGLGIGVLVYLRQRAESEAMVLPYPPAAPSMADDGAGGDDAAEAGDGDGYGDEDGDDEDDVVCALPVLVKLAGRSDAGEVRYVIDRQDEVVGDAALIAALKNLSVWEEADPDDDLPLIVDLDVATASGITQAEVDAAVKACWAAGAAVLRPPEISKEGQPPAPASDEEKSR